MPLLEVRRLTKRFGGLIAIKNLNFYVEKQEILGIIGPNGAGKTTLFNIITGFIRPDEGEIIFKGEDITNLKPYMIVKKGIARTFQLTTAFPNMTVFDNVLVALSAKKTKSSSELKKHVESILKLFGLLNQKDKPASILPLGDLKKLEIARAFATGPDLLLLDELFAGLTYEDTIALMEFLKELNHNGITLVIVEHIMRVVMNLSKRVLVISQGEKIAEGRPQEVAHDKKVIETYLGGKAVAEIN